MTIKKQTGKKVAGYYESIATLTTLNCRGDIVEETIQWHKVLGISAHE